MTTIMVIYLRVLLELGTWIRNNEYHNIDRELRNGNDLRVQPINFLYLADHPLINFPKVWNHLSSDLGSF